MSEKIIRDKQGNIICDLQSPSNGGIDLYDEYNNGVDKIVSSFGVCAKRQREIEQAQRSKEQDLAQNDHDREEDILGLTKEKRNIEKRIQTTKVDADQKREDRKESFEAQKRTLAAERDDRKDQAEQRKWDKEQMARANFMTVIAEKEHKDLSVMESYGHAIDNAGKALAQLESVWEQYMRASSDAKDRISNLENTREAILSDGQIQDRVGEYAADETKYQTFFSKYYEEKRNPGALEQEQQLRDLIKAGEQGQKQEISRRIQERLQDEGITGLLAAEHELPRDENELDAQAKFDARNKILGIFGSRSKKSQRGIKHFAMLLFCYPRELLLDSRISRIDWVALIPAIVFMVTAYLKKPSMGLCVLGWFAALVLYYIISMLRWLPTQYRPVISSVPAKVVSLLYPFYIYLLMRNMKIYRYWLILCVLFYFTQDVIFGVKMCFAKYKQQYDEAYGQAKSSWQNKIQLVQEAKEKKKLYAREEEERVKAELHRQQQELEQLTLANQQEREAIQREFHAYGWPQEVAAWKEQLLRRREEMQQWNQSLDAQVADTEEETKGIALILGQIQARQNEMKTKWMPWLEARQERLRQTYQEQFKRFESQQLHGDNLYSSAQQSDLLVQIPVPDQRQLDRIDWIQTGLQELPDKLKQAEKELDDLSTVLQSSLVEKEQEYNQSLRDVKRAYENMWKEAEAEYERKMEDAEDSFSADWKEITRKCEKQVERLEAEAGHIEDEMTATVKRYREKAQKISAEWDEEIARRRVKYREEMDRRLGQLKENGMVEICGFNYRQAWIRFHALATNTICFPIDVFSLQNRVLTGLMAKAVDVNHEHCELMPRHLMWGVSPVHGNELTPEILGEIEDTLKGCDEFKALQWDKDDIDFYHYERLPSDTFYKLNCVPMEDGPAMIVYDLGNLEQDSRKRNFLMDFILRTFVFGFRQCVGEESHLNFHIISMQHEEYLKNYNRKKLITDNHYHVYTDQSGMKKMIKELQRGREELGLSNAATLYKRNCERSRDGRNPADNYEILVIVNTDYKELEDTGLVSLLEASHRIGMGMYSYLLVDLDTLRRMDDSSRARSTESIQKLANAIEADSRFYEISAVQDGFKIENTGKGNVISAVMECSAEEEDDTWV